MKKFAVFLMLSVIALSSLAAADQRDARLGELFSRLHRSEDIREIAHLQAYIWSIWSKDADKKSSAWMYDGLLALRGKRSNIALQRFDELVNYDPDFAEGWNKRATVLYFVDFLGRFEESIVDIQKVLVLEKRHFGALSGLGLCYEALGDEEAALEAYQRALQVNPHLQFLPGKIGRLRKNIRRRNI